MKPYKYLNYILKPVNVGPELYDLVDDQEFCRPDGRIPLLIVTQHGVFPSGAYPGRHDYGQLHGLENQEVGLLGRGYLSDRERKGIIRLFLDADTVERIRSKALVLDLGLWGNENETNSEKSR
jgi:hypothetical protein